MPKPYIRAMRPVVRNQTTARAPRGYIFCIGESPRLPPPLSLQEFYLFCSMPGKGGEIQGEFLKEVSCYPYGATPSSKQCLHLFVHRLASFRAYEEKRPSAQVAAYATYRSGSCVFGQYGVGPQVDASVRLRP